MKIAAQAGPQTMFERTSADIAIFGGSAGSGKSNALIREPCRHLLKRKGFVGVIFRRNFVQINVPGGLWDTAGQVYPYLGGVPKRGSAEWVWPHMESRMRFAHLEHDDTVFSWMGSAIPFMGFDELPHFTAQQFWYMLSRNRLDRPIGMKPYVRATCNPEPDSWLSELLDWWIGEDGLPIEERSGVVRWFVRRGNDIVWAMGKNELSLQKGEIPKSLTFIPARLEDNPALIAANPDYQANLLSLPLYERSILLDGNWKVKRSKGMRFKRQWFEIVDSVPEIVNSVRYWDRAGTEVTEADRQKGRNKRTADWTAGVHLSKGKNGVYYVTDVKREQHSPAKLIDLIRNTASQDCTPDLTTLWLEQDPGSAGIAERFLYATELDRFGPNFISPSGSKWTRSGSASTAAENGLIKIVRGRWNKEFLDELEAFVDDSIVATNENYHDDQVDALSGAFVRLSYAGEVNIR